MLNVNSELDFEKAEEIAMEFDRLVEMEEQVDVIEELLKRRGRRRNRYDRKTTSCLRYGSC